MNDLAWMRPRLAGLCKLPPTSHDWFPDADMAQALRCLEALYDDGWAFFIGRGDSLEVPHDVAAIGLRNRRDNREIIHTEDFNTPLPRIICVAIAVALGWEEMPK